ncbi:hypothetical protein F66182_1511 [Fusarium sp. NRRL 66182]|nr:hypothetical protein F66182_1511 [Fusarium sp. NRRL 66182]
MAPSWIEKFIVRVDATPDPKRSQETPSLEMHYTALEGHRRVVGVKGDSKPRYEVTRESILQLWGDKCIVTSLVNGNSEIAAIDFHSFPPSTEVEFLQRQHIITVKMSEERYTASGGLGDLHWKPTGMVPYGKASWEVRDETDLVMSVTTDDHQVNGVIRLWRDGLGPETVEELIVMGLSKLEEYRRMMRLSRRSAVQSGSIAPWLAPAIQ